MRTKVIYRGQKVFIGIDVHRKSYFVTAVCDGDVVKRFSVTANPSVVASTLERVFAGAEILTAYEAGFSGFVLHRVLASRGITSIVVHPAAVEVESGNRVKTDKRDSKKLAEQLAAGRLKAIHVPTEELEQRRLLTRTRDQLSGHRVRLMNQIRMKLHQFGVIDCNHSGVLRPQLVQEALKGEVPLELKLSVAALMDVWKGIDRQIQVLSKPLQQQAKQDSRERVYRSVPGFGPLTARTLSNELGDMSQFPNERALFSFTGLTPCEYSSGEATRRGHISRRGSSRLRNILVEAAWVTVRKDPGMAKNFARLSVRLGKKRAIVATARKLVGRARALFRQDKFYERDYQQTG